MKKPYARIALAVTLIGALSSQLAMAERPSKEQRLERMTTHLELTDDQVAEIREIHANGGGREEVHAVLTDDQLTKLKEAHANRKGKGKGRGEAPSEATE